MELQNFIKRATVLLLIIVVGLGFISKLIISNSGLTYFAVNIYSLLSKSSDPDKIIEIFSLINQSWLKLAILVIGVYMLFYIIMNFDITMQAIKHPIREIFHKYHSIKEKSKYYFKQKKFKKATKLKTNTPKKRASKKKIDLSLLKFKKSRKWPDDESIQREILKERIEEFISAKGGYTIPDVMKSLEKDFDLTIIEKNDVLDSLKSLVSSSLRLSRYKNKKQNEVKK